jgi:G:T/U-mismatch repair DNA glycosylase
MWLTVLDGGDDSLTVNEVAGRLDNSIANLSDENDKSRWSVVVLRVVPDEQDVVHDRYEVLNDLSYFLVLVSERQEERFEGLEILKILVSLSSGNLNILLELAERSGHGGLVLFKELEHLLNALLVELLADGVKVGGLVLPEG